MNFKPSIHRGARIDADEALVFYQTEASFHVADAFLDAVDEAVALILKDPLTFHLDSSGARKKQLNKFPFTIFFTVRGDEIRILAIAHHRREPNFWIDRK